MNRSAIAEPRRETIDGKDFLVAPVVMITANVHEGNLGPVRYRSDVLTETLAGWNGKPITLGHPERNGRHVVVADSPDTPIGFVKNARMDGNRLAADAYLDTARLLEASPTLLDAVNRGQAIEVSTGFLMTLARNALGENEAQKLIPDHLAILPGSEGACSIRAGCGLLRNEALPVAPLARYSLWYLEPKRDPFDGTVRPLATPPPLFEPQQFLGQPATTEAKIAPLKRTSLFD
ncbi:DUF2213 domain-containing protein [Stratiformator vulcanicus]|uniref:DUF2213 domain-containing protein n=1 Tax=Stratiformator vulcanicus TaxID=2527980 RepID=UPI0028779A0A|nr:DUF2213 domain-containing protein [Stratiformator vulcanicus]